MSDTGGSGEARAHDASMPASALAPPSPQLAPPSVLAILSLVFAFLFPPIGIVCGHIALVRIRRSGAQGFGLAVAGTVLGYVFLVGWIVFVLFWWAVIATVETPGFG